jgi:EAL domain-containing protein (putative c-di-GMP-specific phosphodiesterase class I)
VRLLVPITSSRWPRSWDSSTGAHRSRTKRFDARIDGRRSDENLEDGRRFADRLVALGCTFALDDFRTGYASLTYLREFLITFVMIDGRFVIGITQNESDSSMVVEAIVPGPLFQTGHAILTR